jgi:hypothetical protein
MVLFKNFTSKAINLLVSQKESFEMANEKYINLK